MKSSLSEDRPPSGLVKPALQAVVIVCAFALGYYLAVLRVPDAHDSSQRPSVSKESGKSAEVKPVEKAAPSVWTCSMHPQIKLPKPGKCPICFMDLIPLDTAHDSGSTDSHREFVMSETAKRLAEVETAEVKREQAKVKVRMVGLVTEDETRVAALTSRVDGRLDQIYVNFTGVTVNQGDPMVTIWSPTLIKSQVELFETIRGDQPEAAVIRGAEEKLIQQGLTREQIKEIKEKRKPDLYVTLRAPINGVVTKKMALLGQFVKEGQEMYFINDLSRVWVKLDAYETDLPWIRFGQEVSFTAPSFPGKVFKGRVLFIDPMLDGKTRSVKVRVDVNNQDYLLKPGMFVSAELDAEVDSKGRVISSEWAGKFVCPVHPFDVASTTPGNCPDSNVPLRSASSFGYSDEKDPQPPLVIPSTAPLITGKRVIVYVEVPNRERPTYELREVVLGPRAGNVYTVYEGLKEGERVVTRGNFKIDSAMQILARTSMMNPIQVGKPAAKPDQAQEEIVEKMKAPDEFLQDLTPVIREYLLLKDALVEAKVDDASQRAGKLRELLVGMKTDRLPEKSRSTWTDLAKDLQKELESLTQKKTLDDQRQVFDPLSESFVKLLMAFRHVMKEPLVVFRCPMASGGQGAYWIEESEERRNPYFGHTLYKGQDMLRCAELIEKIPPERGEKAAAEGQSPEAEKKAEGKADALDGASAPPQGTGASDHQQPR
jgi:membrane fusion protein, copper/silver efflux system